jgi:hypothetical protein
LRLGRAEKQRANLFQSENDSDFFAATCIDDTVLFFVQAPTDIPWQGGLGARFQIYNAAYGGELIGRFRKGFEWFIHCVDGKKMAIIGEHFFVQGHRHTDFGPEIDEAFTNKIQRPGIRIVSKKASDAYIKRQVCIRLYPLPINLWYLAVEYACWGASHD